MIIKLYTLLYLVLLQVVLQAQSTHPSSITIGTKATIYSSILEEDRQIFVHLPVGYDDMDNVPVVLVFDADSQFNQTVSTIDYISNGGQGNDIIPPSIVIGVTNPNRDYDFTPIRGMVGPDTTSINNTGGGPLFLEFITTELLPHIDSSYNTCSHRTLIGHSLGGLFVFHALLDKADYFDNYLAIDPAIGFAEGSYLTTIIDRLSAGDYSNEYLYLAIGNNRPGGMPVEALDTTTHLFLKNCDKANQQLYNLTDTNDWAINMQKVYYPDEGHFSLPFRATYDGLKFCYHYFKFEEMTDLFFNGQSGSTGDLVTKLKGHYAHISQRMGSTQRPQLGYINSWAWGFGQGATKTTAEAMFRYNIELYPDIADVYTNYGLFLKYSGKHTEALDQIERSLKIESNDFVLSTKNDLLQLISQDNNR